jgi:hypothetical protein
LVCGRTPINQNVLPELITDSFVRIDLHADHAFSYASE